MRIKYPLGIQTFSKIINGKMLYIDKTAIIYELLEQGSMYFLSRPRRFGKSLLISTFEALFAGQKALFEGLAIADTDYDFAVYPVIKLEFSRVDVRQGEDLERYIVNTTNRYAKTFGITLEIDSYEQRFEELAIKLYEKTGQAIVFLVDEYDKPILDNLFNDELKNIRNVMNRFYAMVKSLDQYLRFVFITGVSKFAKVSVFSGMNHLQDISMNRDFATLCGITKRELNDNFGQSIDELAIQQKLDKSQLLAKIKYWYNGYLFEENAHSVYNPFSLLSLFVTRKFDNYWFTTATPTFLLDLLQEKQYDLKNLTEFKVGAAAFQASDPQRMEVQSLLVQTGYLTIKSYDPPLYQLDFPNYEVKKSFYDSVAARYSGLGLGEGENYTYQLTQLLQADDMEGFFATLKVFFANIPYDITLQHEKYYQSLFYAIFKLIGLTIEVEVRTNQGRIDCVIKTDNSVYIIEFKLNGTKEEALQQIHSKQYAQKYQSGDQQIVLLGVEFDQKTRNIGGIIRENGRAEKV